MPSLAFRRGRYRIECLRIRARSESDFRYSNASKNEPPNDGLHAATVRENVLFINVSYQCEIALLAVDV